MKQSFIGSIYDLHYNGIIEHAFNKNISMIEGSSKAKTKNRSLEKLSTEAEQSSS